MVVALLSIPGTYPRVLVLESSVADLLAVVALFWSYPTFKNSYIT